MSCATCARGIIAIQVANFAVSRKGVGGIRWDEPVDVRGLQLDSLVRLSKGCIEVYLDDDQKPSEGEGLNKPATVPMKLTPP